MSTGLLLVTCATGCATGAENRVDGSAWGRMQQLIGNAECKTDADCRTIAVGDKACGGPEAYLAWSSLRTDARELASAAAKHADEQRAQRDKQPGRASNCALVTDPGARCEATPPSAAQCVLRRASGGGSRAD